MFYPTTWKINRGLEVVRGFEKVLGLTTLQVEVLRAVRPDSDTSALDVASRVGDSKRTVSRALNFLNERRLVRTIEVKRKKVFRRLIDLPEVPSEFVPLELSKVEIEKGRVIQPKLREQDIREAVKGALGRRRHRELRDPPLPRLQGRTRVEEAPQVGPARRTKRERTGTLEPFKTRICRIRSRVRFQF